MIRIVEDMRDVNIYLSLRNQVGWIKLDENQAQRALNNSVISIYRYMMITSL